MSVRTCNPALDSILGEKRACGTDGFVRLVDYMGDESAIVQAARVSYGAGTKSVRDDAALITYLYRHEHTTPFEMVELKFHVRVPMDVWRQWIRTRTASVNEHSTRYSEAIDSMAMTPADAWRLQSGSNKQGSDGFLDAETGARLSDQERRMLEMVRNVYERRLVQGVAREQARKDLPLSTYTEAYWKINLHNLLRFLNQRLDSHAQQEIREYAGVIADIVATGYPTVWRVFKDNSTAFGAFRLSLTEQELAARAARGELSRNEAVKVLGKREAESFFGKLAHIGVAAPDKVS